MTDREQIEQEIRASLTEDIDSVTFSNRLFGQFTGLFPRLGPTPEARREITRSELWKQAQSRLRDLEARDVARFREVARKVEEHRPPGSYVLRLEPPAVPTPATSVPDSAAG